MKLPALLRKVPPLAWVALVPMCLIGTLIAVAWLWAFVASWHRVDAGAWRTTIYVQRFEPMTVTGKCATVPANARDLVRLGQSLETYQSGTRTGACRQDCTTRSHVVGGKLRTQQDCKTVCDKTPVFDTREYERCQWVVDAWQEVDRRESVGLGLTPAPIPADVNEGARPETAPYGTEWRTASVAYERRVTGFFGREQLCTFYGPSTWLTLEAGEWFRIPHLTSSNDLFCFEREQECAQPSDPPRVLCGPDPS
ncbi:MAG: hypothetical protein IV100_11445 [Myxococcales bacterium]|nr:hypothetical protein [Myxococcales bacterium]